MVFASINVNNYSWTATGQDVFEDLDFFKQKLMFDAFGLWPRTFGNPDDVSSRYFFMKATSL